MKNTITGDRNLANALGVYYMTVYSWKKEGILDAAIIVRFRRTTIYDGFF